MKLVFFGNPKFASDSLEFLINKNYNIELIITNPDKKQGRGQKLSPSNVKLIANKYKQKVFEINSLNNEKLIKKLHSINPDIAIVVAYKYIPKNIFTIPKIATINLHASILPKYIGASPIQYTLLNGDKTSGLTTFVVNEKIDEGKIIYQKKIPIDDKTTYNSLYKELSSLGGEVLDKSINLLKNKHPLKTQNIKNKVLAPKIKKEDFIIDWNNSAINIHNQIRALSFKGAFSKIDGKRIKFFETYFINKTKNNINLKYPGDFIIKEAMYIKTGKGYLIVNKIQIEGRNITNVNKISSNSLFNKNKFK